MVASVSRAAGERRRGRNVNCARSIASAYSRRDRNCQPCAISTSSTPWPPVAYVSRTSLSAARTVPSPACGSSEHSSSTVSGRDAANRAASSSFASGLTADHDGAERPVLVDLERAALGELEQRDEGGEHVHDRRAGSHDIPPRELLAWRDVVGARATVVDVLSAFIALLELAKRGALKVHQDGAFGPIVIRREPAREAA